MQDKKETSFDKIISASSRFRPSETIVFDPPLEGKNGAKLTSYTWSYEWTMKPSSEGELVSKRVSDWTQAEISADTGRDIVHQYTVLMPNGESKTVSSDSVPVLLGYLDKKELKSFPNLVTASKTLAKQQMQLAILEAQKKEYDELYSKFEKAEKPEIKEVGEDSKFLAATERYKKGAYSNYAMGDVTYRQDNDYVYETESYKKRPISRTTIEQLTWAWISKRVEENGGVNPRELYDLKNRVARQKRKVENILNAKKNELSKPVPQGNNGANITSNSRNEEVSIELQKRIREAQKDARVGEGKGDTRQIDNKVALEYAKETNTWIEDLYSLGDFFVGGNENSLAYNEKESVVYKSNNLSNVISLLDFFEKIKLHNSIFLNTRYTFVGFSGISDANGMKPYVEPVYKQDFIKDAEFATISEIDEYMIGLGFEKIADYKYKKDNIEVWDLRPRNVLKDPNGDIYVIDAEFKELVERKENKEMTKEEKLRKGKKEAYLNKKTSYNNKSMTNKEFLDTLIAEGRKLNVVDVTDTNKKNKTIADWEWIKGKYPFGNENHPQTIEAMRLKKIIDTQDWKKPEYRFEHPNGYFITLDKFAYEYVLDKMGKKEDSTELNIDGFEIKKIGSLKDGDHIQYEFDVHEISKSFNHRLVGTIEKNPDDKYSAMYMNEMYEENYEEKDFKKFEDAEEWVLSKIKKEIKRYKEDFGTRYEKEVEHELEKGKAVEMEHKETLDKVATGEITPEEGVLETAETHIAEDPKYYDKLEAIEMSPEKQAELKSFKQRVELLLRREYSKTTTDKLMEENNSMIEDDFSLLRTADRTFREIQEAHEKPQKEKYNSLISNSGINSERIDNWNQVPVVWKNTKPISKVNFVNTPYNKELIKLLDTFAGNDALRPVMSGIHFDGNGITATNAHKLISLPYPNPEYNGTYATIPKRDYSQDKDIKDDLFVSTKYPNYEAVTPKAENAIGIYEFSVYKALQYTRVALKFANKVTNQIAFSFGDTLIAFNGEFLSELLETALKLGHTKLFSFTTAPNRAIVLSPDRNYEIGKSEIFLLMPVLIVNDDVNYKGGAMDLDFNREIKVYYDFSTDSIYNANGTLAEFKMNYGEYDILKPNEIKALDKYAGNNPTIFILENFKVEDGKVFASNLETGFTIKDSNLKDGLYKVLNGAIEYDGNQTLSSYDDFPKIKIEGELQLGFVINSEILKFYIEKAIEFTGDDDIRPVMKGICFDYNNGQMFMVATDAHKLFKVEITEYIETNAGQKDFQFILSQSNLMKFLKVLDESPIEVKAYNKNVVFDTDDYNFTSKTIDGRYPNYNGVISAFKNKKITINVKDLFICLKSKEAQDFIKKHKKEDVMLIDRAGSKENELDLYLFVFEDTRDNSSRKIEDEVKICTVKYKYEEGTYQTHSNVILLMPIMSDEDASHFAFREKFFREILDVVNCEDVEIFYDEKNRAYLIDGDCFKYKHTIQAAKKSPVKASVVEEVRTEKEIVEQEEKDKEVIEEQFNEPDADLIDRSETENIVLLHNKEKSPNMGSKYGQDVEPSGYYAIKKETNALDSLPNYETVYFEPKKPLFIEVNDDTLVSWKYDLSKKYKAKKKKLSDKLISEGYDIIITRYPNGSTGEIIVLDTSRIKTSSETKNENSDAEDAIVLLNDLLEDAKGKQKKTILEAINLLKDLLDEPTDEKKEVRGEYQKGYEDLYLPDVVEMPINTTIEQLINEYDKYSGGKSNAIIKFRLGNRDLIAHRKYTFQGRNVVKTKYIHIEWVDDFNKKYPIVYKTWKETKSGIKETTNPSINDWNRKNK